MKEVVTTEAEAVELHKTKFWEKMSYRERAVFQLFTKRLCMPFDIFHEAVEKVLKRPVYTHEFGFNVEGLKKEIMGAKPAPTLEEIIELIPESKRIIVCKNSHIEE